MIVTDQKLVSFYVGEKIYGIDLMYVQEFIENIECTELPEVLNYITGVVNLRGRIITVADMGLIFENQRCQSKRLLMVMRNNFNKHKKSQKGAIAFLVDDNGPIIQAMEDDFVELPDFNDNDSSHLCSHAIKTEKRMLSVIDPEKLFEVLLDDDE